MIFLGDDGPGDDLSQRGPGWTLAPITPEQRLRWALSDLLAAIAQCATTRELELHESYRQARAIVWGG